MWIKGTVEPKGLNVVNKPDDRTLLIQGGDRIRHQNLTSVDVRF